MVRAVGCMLVLGALGGCRIVLSEEFRNLDGSGLDAGPSSRPPFSPPTGTCAEPAAVDLLILVDNSASMAEEQASFVSALPGLVRSLVDPPDANFDGQPDWLPIPDVRVGVITTDMGTGGHSVPTCARPDFGDDGALRTNGRTSVPGCMATYPSYTSLAESGGSVEAFARDVACVAETGVNGCGFEQPLEAILKALSPATPAPYTASSYVSPQFFRATLGNGDGTNAGFVREDSLLAIIVLTDEEDCSASDPELYDLDPESTYGQTDLTLRCFAHAGAALHPVERYVEGLVALRAGRPDLLALAVIGGVPPDLVEPVSTAAGYARMGNDARMVERVDPAFPSRLVPSCDTSRGIAFPPRRMLAVAQQLSASRSTVQSICEASLVPATDAIARLFGSRACARYGAAPSVDAGRRDAGAPDAGSTPGDEGDLRLVASGTPGSARGRLEVFLGGTWGTVCDDAFDGNAAAVACRQLGFSEAVETFDAVPGVLPIVMDDVTCNGTESRLVDCEFLGATAHNCSHPEDVGLACR